MSEKRAGEWWIRGGRVFGTKADADAAYRDAFVGQAIHVREVLPGEDDLSAEVERLRERVAELEQQLADERQRRIDDIAIAIIGHRISWTRGFSNSFSTMAKQAFSHAKNAAEAFEAERERRLKKGGENE